MTDDVKQILAQWESPEPPADLAERIIAASGERAYGARPVPRFALAASLVLALGLGLALQHAFAPQPQQEAATIDGIPMLADVDLYEGDDFAFLDDGEESEL